MTTRAQAWEGCKPYTMELVKQVPIKIGTWEGTTDLTVVQMDDFDIILGMKFLAENSVSLRLDTQEGGELDFKYFSKLLSKN